MKPRPSVSRTIDKSGTTVSNGGIQNDWCLYQRCTVNYGAVFCAYLYLSIFVVHFVLNLMAFDGINRTGQDKIHVI